MIITEKSYDEKRHFERLDDTKKSTIVRRNIFKAIIFKMQKNVVDNIYKSIACLRQTYQLVGVSNITFL